MGRTLIVLAAVAFLGFVVLPFAVMESHAVSMAQLSEIQKGESSSDVERRLGVPEEIRRSKSGDSWVYGGEFTWCIVAIHFDANGVVSGIEHDH